MREQIALDSNIYQGTLTLLSTQGVISEEKSVVRLLSHRRTLTDDQEAQVVFIMHKLREDPFSPHETIETGGELVNFLVEEQRIVKIDDHTIFHSETYENIVSDVTKCIKDQGDVTVADVRDLLGTSRKYALLIMDYMDQQQITKRVGDTRILR